MHPAKGENEYARAEVDRAMQMSEDMRYHWGKVDAGELIAALRASQWLNFAGRCFELQTLALRLVAHVLDRFQFLAMGEFG